MKCNWNALSSNISQIYFLLKSYILTYVKTSETSESFVTIKIFLKALLQIY